VSSHETWFPHCLHPEIFSEACFVWTDGSGSAFAPKEARLRITEKVERLSKQAEYFTLDGLITQEMGGGGGTPSPASIQGAVNRALKCIERGGKWTRVDPDSGQWEFRREKKIEYNDYSTTHRQSKEERTNAKSISTAASSADGSGAGNQDDVTPEKVVPTAAAASLSGQAPKADAAPSARSSAKAGAKSTGKAKAKGKAKGKAKPKATAGKMDASTVKRKADSVMGTYHRIMNRAAKRQKQIKEEPKWEWANTDKFLGRLDKYVLRVGVELDKFPSFKNMIEDGEALDDSALTAVAQSLASIDNVKTALDNVESQIDRLTSMHEQDVSMSQ
jgi:hypothetical protein